MFRFITFIYRVFGINFRKNIFDKTGNCFEIKRKNLISFSSYFINFMMLGLKT